MRARPARGSRLRVAPASRHARCSLSRKGKSMPTAESSVRDRPTSVELQDDIMRFEGRFSSRLVTAFEPLIDSSDLAVRHRAARDELDFMSAALDIAVGSEPEVNLLDMVTLVALGRDAMARRWDVDVYGEAGRAVVEAFAASESRMSRRLAAARCPRASRTSSDA